MHRFLIAATLAAGLCAAPRLALAQASPAVVGTLSNFDVVNDTGGETEGFEIELDGVAPADITFTFGGTYNRYGSPQLVAFAGGTYVRYLAPWDPAAQQFTTGTPVANPSVVPTGHTCWSGALGATAYLNSGCEHFGVGLAYSRAATQTVYRWLVADPANPGSVLPLAGLVSIPAPVWSVLPAAAPGLAPIVVAVLPAPPPPRPELQFGVAQWVKVFKTELPRAVGLDELLSDNAVVPQDAANLESGYSLLQTNPHRPDNGGKRSQGGLGSGSRSVVRRYELYKYAGQYDPLTHEALCADPTCAVPADGEVGDYVGAQMAAANVDIPTLTLQRIGAGTVSDGGKLKCGTVCSEQVAQGTVVSLTASAPSGGIFAGWSDDCSASGLGPTCTVTVNAAVTATATFKTLYTLSIGRGGSGTVTGDPAGASGAIGCGNRCSAKFADGTTVTLSATPAAGLHFVNWTGACAGTDPVCRVTIGKDTQAQANFSK